MFIFFSDVVCNVQSRDVDLDIPVLILTNPSIIWKNTHTISRSQLIFNIETNKTTEMPEDNKTDNKLNTQRLS